MFLPFQLFFKKSKGAWSVLQNVTHPAPSISWPCLWCFLFLNTLIAPTKRVKWHHQKTTMVEIWKIIQSRWGLALSFYQVDNSVLCFSQCTSNSHQHWCWVRFVVVPPCTISLTVPSPFHNRGGTALPLDYWYGRYWLWVRFSLGFLGILSQNWKICTSLSPSSF